MFPLSNLKLWVVWFYKHFWSEYISRNRRGYPTARNQYILYYFSKKAVLSHSELSYKSKTFLLPLDPQNKWFLSLCSNKFDSSTYFKSQKIFFISCKQMSNHRNPAAPVKNISLQTAKVQLYVRSWWSRT